MKNVIVIIRYVFSALLIYGIYRETGIFTAMSLALILIAVEIICKSLTEIQKCLQLIIKAQQ
jgi:hypothetical protein